MFAPFDRFSLQMTTDQARSASQSGRDAAEDVRELLRDPRIARQLRKIAPADIRAELKEYGAWDDRELADDDANRERIVWIAAGNIREALAERGRGLRGARPLDWLGAVPPTPMTSRLSFEQHARAVLAAVKVGDCDGAKIAAARAIHQAKTPHQRDVIYKLQHKVLRCTIKSAGLGRARRRRK